MIAADSAVEDEVFAVTELLRRHFAEKADDGDITAMTRQAVEESLEVMNAFDEGGDIGVGAFYAKSTDELSKLLDFPHSRPVLWNQFRALDSAVTPWDTGETDATRVEFQTGSARMNSTPITLFPHQMQAIASVVKMMFSTDRVNDKGGVLIADGVGLGKSATLFGIHAFLGQVFEYQRGVQDEAIKTATSDSEAAPRSEPKAKIFSNGMFFTPRSGYDPRCTTWWRGTRTAR